MEENTIIKHPAIFSKHFRIIIPSYRNHNNQIQKIQRIVKYVFLTGAILALFMVTIFVHWPKTDSAQNENSDKEVVKKMRENEACVLKTRQFQNKDYARDVECTDLDLSNGSEKLLKILADFRQQGIFTLNLILRDAKHKGNKLENGWLNLEENIHPKINSLTIDNKFLNELGENSFGDFKDLTEIVLINTNVDYLARKAFQDSTKVWTLSLRNNKKLNAIESNLLRQFSLSTLQIEGMDFTKIDHSEQFFQNLTGNKDLSTLTILELRTNKIPEIRKEYLKNFPQLISLYLISNQIQKFQESSFDALRQIQLVHVTENEIEKFPESVFGYLLNERKALVYIGSNPIICDCELTWLLESIMKNNLTLGISDAKCKSPEWYANDLIETVELCQNTSNPTKAPTTELSTSTDNPQAIKCADMKTKTFLSINQPLMSLISYSNVSQLSVVEEENSDNIQLIINSDEDYLALAFICRECNEIICQTVENRRKIEIRGLEASKDYLFCLFGGMEITTGRVDLRSCLAYRTQPLMNERPWIRNGEKNLIIASIVLSIFIVFVIGALISFLIVRNKPTLLKGSGRIEVVKSRDGDLVLVMPERRNAPSPCLSSGTYDTISGYISLTPRQKTPPPLPPYPPTWFKRNKEDPRRNPENHEYLEPKRLYPIKLPRNKDLLLEYEWYTQQYRQE